MARMRIDVRALGMLSGERSGSVELGLLRGGMLSGPASMLAKLVVILSYLLEVVNGLGVGGNAFVLGDRVFACVVGGDGQVQVAFVVVQQPPEVADSSSQILPRIVCVP